MAELANTQARLSTSITLRAFRGDVQTAALGDDEIIALLADPNQGKVIGAVITFSEENPRPTTPRYELDAAKAGEMVERTPGLADNTLTLNRVVLYENDMLEAFGFTDAQSIIDQNIPFFIVKIENVPVGSTAQARTTYFLKCWFHNLPKTFDITGDLRVMQNVEVGYTKKIVQ